MAFRSFLIAPHCPGVGPEPIFLVNANESDTEVFLKACV